MKDQEARQDIRELQSRVLKRKSGYGLEERVDDLWSRFLVIEEAWNSRFTKVAPHWEEKKDKVEH